MICKLCGDKKVVYTMIDSYGVQSGPCPNCTDYVHKHYERELESVINHEQRRITPSGSGC
ncbi:hypothetical protein TUA1478L_33920 [Lactiplantibacillus plantarum]